MMIINKIIIINFISLWYSVNEHNTLSKDEEIESR